METLEAKFKLSFTNEQYDHARQYVEDMKKHPRRVYWLGKKGKSDKELIVSQIVHRILSGFYNNYDPSFAKKQILELSTEL